MSVGIAGGSVMLRADGGGSTQTCYPSSECCSICTILASSREIKQFWICSLILYSVDADFWAFIFTFVWYFVCFVLFTVYVCTVCYCLAVCWAMIPTKLLTFFETSTRDGNGLEVYARSRTLYPVPTQISWTLSRLHAADRLPAESAISFCWACFRARAETAFATIRVHVSDGWLAGSSL